MMDIDKLIKQLRRFGGELGATPLNNVIGKYMLQAADALEELQAELEQAKEERDVAVEYLRGQCPRCGSIHLSQRVDGACYYCFDCGAHIIPSAPMRHGYWMDSSNGWTCSECCSDNIRDTKWCPNCGAKMDRKVPD